VSRSHLTVSREYDLPRSIVWDAFVDADLVSGWLAPAAIEPWVGGRYNLAWSGSTSLPPTIGVIEELDEPSLIIVRTSIGRLEFRLKEFEGGTRTTSTRLTVTIAPEADAGFPSGSVAHWLTNLEQLESLLRGKPVNWENWDHDWRPIWLGHISNKKVTKPI
jgi:uncharacterized protein YndB with AHSA1/START domain